MAYHQGPWESDRATFHLGMRPKPSRGDEAYRPHPIFAPLAWICCLLIGAAFWLAVYRLIF